MIRWDLSKDKFDVEESTSSNQDTIIAECTCGAIIEIKLQSYKNNRRKNGEFLCQDCKRNKIQNPSKQDLPYPLVGEEPEEGQNKKSFLFPIEEFREIIPRDYFVTTGEGIIKLDVMISDLKENLEIAKKYRKKILISKDDAQWMETSWDGKGNLILKKKYSRPRSPKNKDK